VLKYYAIRQIGSVTAKYQRSPYRCRSNMPRLSRIAAFCALFSIPALAQIDPRVETAIVTETPINGVSTTPDGRVFLLYARVDGSTGPTIVERIGNTTEAYPNLEWNSYNSTKDPATHFVRINSQRIGPDGHLWAVQRVRSSSLSTLNPMKSRESIQWATSHSRIVYSTTSASTQRPTRLT
jgi:hypothetical protein